MFAFPDPLEQEQQERKQEQDLEAKHEPPQAAQPRHRHRRHFSSDEDVNDAQGGRPPRAPPLSITTPSVEEHAPVVDIDSPATRAAKEVPTLGASLRQVGESLAASIGPSVNTSIAEIGRRWTNWRGASAASARGGAEDNTGRREAPVVTSRGAANDDSDELTARLARRAARHERRRQRREQEREREMAARRLDEDEDEDEDDMYTRYRR